jgi:Fur family peroxide stress response transcriptional regulator
VPVGDEDSQRRIDEMTAALRAAGLRLTHQRLEVAREIAASDEHPSVERVFRAARVRVPTISLDTVYRTLATLADLGLVSRVTATPGPVRYDATRAPHHHFVCTRCGLIRDVENHALDELPVPASAEALGRVESVEVQLLGVCGDCQRKEAEHV